MELDPAPPPPPPRSRYRDLWQLHIPLVIVLAVCAALTVIEARRATEGVWRAWWYMIEWPLFGLFAIWVWYRYRHEGSVTKGMVQRWRNRVEALNAEADRAAEPPPIPIDDPDLQAWTDYRDDLRRRQPPGGPGDQGAAG
jgi:hypothetical protein